MASETKRRRLSAIDWTLIVAAVILAVSALWRLGLVKRFIPKQLPTQADYLVSFRVENIRSTSGDLFVEGTEFALEDGTLFGKITGSVAVTPAELYMEDSEGKVMLTYYPEDGDDSRIDVSGTFLCKASVSEEKGLLMLGGTKYLAPGQTWTLYSGELTVMVTVVDVTEK